MDKVTKNKTLIMVQCAVFLAMSFVVRLVEQSFPITMGGVQFMKLGLTSPFTMAPAILFGPTYGLVMGLLSDLMNLFAPNGGAWIPWLTMTAALRGWLVGLIWVWIKNADPIRVRNWIRGIFYTIGLVGVMNLLVSKIGPQTAYGQLILELNGREKTIPGVMTYGFILLSVIVLSLVWVALKIEKSPGFYAKNRNVNNLFLLLIAITLPSVLQTTLNTFILRAMLAQHANIAFIIYYIPRVAKTLIVSMIGVFIIHDIILFLYQKMYPQMYTEAMNDKRQNKISPC